MIQVSELRLGNYILHKAGVRVQQVQVSFQHFELFAKGLTKDAYPILLKPEVLVKCGFVENKKYYLHPDTREFILPLPVMGKNKNEILAYINSGGETYARAAVNDLIISNNFHHLHQLQNLYFLLVGTEMNLVL